MVFHWHRTDKKYNGSFVNDIPLFVFICKSYDFLVDVVVVVAATAAGDCGAGCFFKVL